MRRPWSGVALFSVSLLLHAGALLLLLHTLGPKRDRETPSSSIALVWIRAPQLPAPPAALTPPKPERQRRAMAPPRSRPRAAPTARLADTTSVAPVAPPAVVAEPLPDARPVFDHAAALASARKLASEPDPARAGSVGAQIEARRVLSETQDEKMGRTIASGKRSDCLGPNAGGSLLSPLMWLLEKKGSGCKLL